MKIKLLSALMVVVMMVACTEATSSNETDTTIDDTDFEAVDWSTETHSKDADPNFFRGIRRYTS